MGVKVRTAPVINEVSADRVVDGRQAKQFQNVTVIKHGGTLIVPEKMPYAAAVEVLMQKALEEEQLVKFKEVIPGFVLDGAYAWQRATEECLGIVISKATPTMFGPKPPEFISVQINPEGEKVSVLWGRMAFPFAEMEAKKKAAPAPEDEVLYSSVEFVDGKYMFCATGEVRHKYLPIVQQIATRAREIVEQKSIYRGHPIRVSFTKADGKVDPNLHPQFLDVKSLNMDDVVYTKSIEGIIQNFVLTPIMHADACRKAGIPLKRGILAAGPYGTGKTLLALAVGQVATTHGWTFIYIKNAKELPHAIRFATIYQPCVVFAEDLDRAVTGETRTEEIDSILNTLDGIDAKSQEIMVILTTNHLEHVNAAMKRPGRLDVVIDVQPPDEEAVQRLIRRYGREQLPADGDLSIVGAKLRGRTPAVVREVVERAKMIAISSSDGDHNAPITVAHLESSADQMVMQLNLLAIAPPSGPSLEDKFIETVQKAVTSKTALDKTSAAAATATKDKLYE